MNGTVRYMIHLMNRAVLVPGQIIISCIVHESFIHFQHSMQYCDMYGFKANKSTMCEITELMADLLFLPSLDRQTNRT